jgi:hypothetical protein
LKDFGTTVPWTTIPPPAPVADVHSPVNYPPLPSSPITTSVPTTTTTTTTPSAIASSTTLQYFPQDPYFLYGALAVALLAVVVALLIRKLVS